MEKKPNMLLIPGLLLALDGDTAEVATVCETVRPEVSSDRDVIELMKFCKESGDELSWASSVELCIVADNGNDIVSCSQPPDGARLDVSKSCSGFTMR